MLRYASLLLAATLMSALAFGQKTRVSGTVKDADSGEPLISANILYAAGQGVVADLDGKYSFQIENGSYTLNISYIGYEAQEIPLRANGGTI